MQKLNTIKVLGESFSKLEIDKDFSNKTEKQKS